MKSAYGIFFDNHFESHFDMGKENSNYYYFAAVDGNIDYYFINGPQIKEVVKVYIFNRKNTISCNLDFRISQSRWSYAT